jgi:cytochrome c553
MMRMRICIVLALALGACSSSDGAQAAGDPGRGKELAAPCVTCHGSDGIALMKSYPNLAGQNSEYMESAIKAYRDGERTGVNAAQMIPMAKQLNDQQIADLAAYFASLPPKPDR